MQTTLFARKTSQSKGLMFGPDGRLFTVSERAKRVFVHDMKGGIEIVAEGIEGRDLVVNSKGDIWITEPKAGKVWHIPPGKKPREVAEKLRPTGIILTPDEGTLVVTDSVNPHLWAFRVEEDGRLTCRDGYFQPVRFVLGVEKIGSHGMTFDKAGRIYVATWAGIQMFDPTGRPSGVIPQPKGSFVTNAVFGGSDFSWMYVTCVSHVYRRKMKSPGAPYFLHAGRR